MAMTFLLSLAAETDQGSTILILNLCFAAFGGMLALVLGAGKISKWSLIVACALSTVAMGLLGFFLLQSEGIQYSNTNTFLVNGLSKGGIYALIAIGYTMVYGIIKLVNFAHGEIFMIAAFLLLTLLDDPTSETSRLGVIPPERLFLIIGLFVLAGSIAVYTLFRNRLTTIPLVASALTVGALNGVILYFGGRGDIAFVIALPLTLYLMASLGVTLDTVAYKPLRNAPRLAPLISALGCSLILMNISIVMWESLARNFQGVGLPNALTSNALVWGAWSSKDIWIVVVALASMGILWALVNHTKLGMAMRAVSLDKDTSKLMGIDVDKVIAATFALGTVVAAIGAFLYERRQGEIKPTMSLQVGIIAFAAAVLGGIGSIPGAVLGGFLIAIATQAVLYFDNLNSINEYFVSAHINSVLQWMYIPERFQLAPDLNLTAWEPGIAYAVLVFFLIVRPEGILGKKSADRA